MTITRTKQGILFLACLLIAWVCFKGGSFEGEVRATTAQSGNTRARAGFPHQKPKHKTLECSKCHTVTAAQPEVDKFPGHASCSSCHNLALESLTKPVLFCGICHDGRPVSRNQPALFRFPKPQVETDFGTDFSHPSHLRPLPLGAGGASDEIQLIALFDVQLGPGQTPQCTDCHRKVEPATLVNPQMTVETGHRVCFQCHGEKPIKPPALNQCAECHQIDGPHSPGLFGLVKEFKHTDHEFDTRPRKKRDYAVPRPPDYLCRECHQTVVTAQALDQIKLPEESYCSECHNGKLGLPETLAIDVLESLRKR